MDLLKVSGIHKQEERNIILDNISFAQASSQKIAIAGESGAGKSTLLKIIGGLIQPDSGEVLFYNTRVEGPFEKLIPGHPKIAYLSQHFELSNNYRVEEILSYSNKLQEREVNTLYELCHIDHLLGNWTSQLSGGEKQRIALARLLISAPDLLLLDEPFSNLDLIHKNILKSVMSDLGQKLHITFLLTSHDPVDTLSWADEIIIMKSGKIIQQASPENIYNYPADNYAAGLFGKYTLPSKTMLEKFDRLSANNKRSFLRPEDFVLVNNRNASLPGAVSTIHYMGSHYDIEVALEDVTVTVNVATNTFSIGERVCVALNF
jgi:ABC-type sugar transport system ATPase subunit